MWPKLGKKYALNLSDAGLGICSISIFHSIWTTNNKKCSVVLAQSRWVTIPKSDRCVLHLTKSKNTSSFFLKSLHYLDLVWNRMHRNQHLEKTSQPAANLFQFPLLLLLAFSFRKINQRKIFLFLLYSTSYQGTTKK